MNSVGMLEAFYVAAAIAFYLHYLYYKKQKAPKIKLRELNYDGDGGRLELQIENTGSETCFVKPSLRIARLAEAAEWKEHTTNGNGLPMIAGAAENGCSVIKGYDLLGYHEEPVPVEAGESKTLVYYLTCDVDIRAYDNIKVDLQYGANPQSMQKRMQDNMTVKLAAHSFEDEASAAEEIKRQSGAALPAEASLNEPVTEVPLDGGFTQVEVDAPLDGGVAEPCLDVPLDGILFQDEPEPAPEELRQLKESGFPVEAMCFCCGKTKWLKFVFDEHHVCEECKQYLMEKHGLPEPAKIELDSEHMQIIHLLRREGGLPLKTITEKLGAKKTAVDRNLKTLINKNQLKREKQGRQYTYYLNE